MMMLLAIVVVVDIHTQLGFLVHGSYSLQHMDEFVYTLMDCCRLWLLIVGLRVVFGIVVCWFLVLLICWFGLANFFVKFPYLPYDGVVGKNGFINCS